MAQLTFDGINKLIIVNAGVVNIDAKLNLYSEWKLWVLSGNAGYEPAFRAVGGDSIGGGVFVGGYFFLQNQKGWRIRPDTDLEIVGNLYAENTNFPMFAQSLGLGTFTIKQTVSSITQATSSSSGSLTTAQNDKLMSIPQNPVLITDSRLSNLDAPISGIAGSTHRGTVI